MVAKFSSILVCRLGVADLTNKKKQLEVDPERAPLVREAFELIASGRHMTADSVLNMVTALG
jgi:hypothetical protein